jgi:hypothetical protein
VKKPKINNNTLHFNNLRRTLFKINGRAELPLCPNINSPANAFHALRNTANPPGDEKIQFALPDETCIPLAGVCLPAFPLRNSCQFAKFADKNFFQKYRVKRDGPVFF